MVVSATSYALGFLAIILANSSVFINIGRFLLVITSFIQTEVSQFNMNLKFQVFQWSWFRPCHRHSVSLHCRNCDSRHAGKPQIDQHGSSCWSHSIQNQPRKALEKKIKFDTQLSPKYPSRTSTTRANLNILSRFYAHRSQLPVKPVWSDFCLRHRGPNLLRTYSSCFSISEHSGTASLTPDQNFQKSSFIFVYL